MSSSDRSGRQAVRNPSFMRGPPPMSPWQPRSRTASVMTAARWPSLKLGSPSGRGSGDRGIRIGHEGGEAVLVSLGVARRQPRVVGAAAGCEGVRSTGDDLVGGPPTDPQGVRDAPGRRRRPRRCRRRRTRAGSCGRARPGWPPPNRSRRGRSRTSPSRRPRFPRLDLPSVPVLLAWAWDIWDTRRVMRCPVVNSMTSHQWTPMSPNARDPPPRSGSTLQFVSCELESQSWR